MPHEISLTAALALVAWISFVSEMEVSFSVLSPILVAAQQYNVRVLMDDSFRDNMELTFTIEKHTRILLT
jgi:hypothetical protein